MKTKLLLIFILLFTSVCAKDIYRESLVKWEGYSETVYKCPAGKDTIGIGHNLEANKQPVRHYSTKEIEQFYQHDIEQAIEIARQGVSNYDTLSDDVKRVVVSLIFTVGGNGFTKFKLFRKALSERNYTKAAYELKNSKWWTDVSKERASNHYNVLMTTR